MHIKLNKAKKTRPPITGSLVSWSVCFIFMKIAPVIMHSLLNYSLSVLESLFVSVSTSSLFTGRLRAMNTLFTLRSAPGASLLLSLFLFLKSMGSRFCCSSSGSFFTKTGRLVNGSKTAFLRSYGLYSLFGLSLSPPPGLSPP